MARQETQPTQPLVEAFLQAYTDGIPTSAQTRQESLALIYAEARALRRSVRRARRTPVPELTQALHLIERAAAHGLGLDDPEAK